MKIYYVPLYENWIKNYTFIDIKTLKTTEYYDVDDDDKIVAIYYNNKIRYGVFNNNFFNNFTFNNFKNCLLKCKELNSKLVVESPELLRKPFAMAEVK